MDSLRRYLPSKKFTKIAGVSLAVIVLGYFIFLYTKTYSSIKNPLIVTETTTPKEIIERDLDFDGVPDWEEALWGTDSNNPSTFNEPDKQYIAKKRAEVSNSTGGEGTASVENLNDTEKIAREFLTTIIALHQAGTLNTFNIENLAQKFSGDIGQNVDLPNHYVIADIKTSADTKEAKSVYYSKIKAAITTGEKGGMGTELEVIALSFGEEPAKTADFQMFAKTYSTLAKELAAMAVPPGARSSHIAFLNESYNMSLIFKNMTEINDNSIVGLIAVAQFEKHEPKLEAAVASLAGYFEANGIIR